MRGGVEEKYSVQRCEHWREGGVGGQMEDALHFTVHYSYLCNDHLCLSVSVLRLYVTPLPYPAVPTKRRDAVHASRTLPRSAVAYNVLGCTYAVIAVCFDLSES